MNLLNHKRFYCCLPLHQKDEILRSGIRPRRLTGGEVIRIFPSRTQIEHELFKGKANRLLISVDGSKLQRELFRIVDRNHFFYSGIIPSSALGIVKEKGNINGKKPKKMKRPLLVPKRRFI